MKRLGTGSLLAWLATSIIVAVVVLCAMAVIGGAVFSLVLASRGYAQDGLTSSRPEGHYGVGHAEHHQHYLGLRNRNGGSCCNGDDGRPTTARWNGVGWEAMVNGVWIQMHDMIVLTPEVLERQGRERWDSQALVFTSKSGTPPRIYCFLPPASGG